MRDISDSSHPTVPADEPGKASRMAATTHDVEAVSQLLYRPPEKVVVLLRAYSSYLDDVRKPDSEYIDHGCRRRVIDTDYYLTRGRPRSRLQGLRPDGYHIIAFRPGDSAPALSVAIRGSAIEHQEVTCERSTRHVRSTKQNCGRPGYRLTELLTSGNWPAYRPETRNPGFSPYTPSLARHSPAAWEGDCVKR